MYMLQSLPAEYLLNILDNQAELFSEVYDSSFKQ